MIAVVLVSGCVGQATEEVVIDETDKSLKEDIGNVESLSEIGSGKGKIVFAITDSLLDIGTIDSFLLTIGKVEIHEEGGSWSAISLQPRTYDLLSLKGVDRFLAETNADPGTYDQLRLTISNSNLVIDGKPKAVTIPSNIFTLTGKVTAVEGTSAYVRIDFLPEESLHETITGKTVFAPVVNYQTWREAVVTIDQGYLNRDNGHKLADKSLGMDISGETGMGMQIGDDDKIEIDDQGNLILLSKEVKAATKVVQISGYHFGPNSIKIVPGDTIKWINNDDVIHIVEIDDGSGRSGDLNKGDNWEHVFTEEDVFSYHCHTHPYMTGTIYVE